METPVIHSSGEVNHLRKKHRKWYKNWKVITIISIGMVAALLGGISYYQANYFNSNKTINHINVGGLTAEQAFEKLQTTELKNEIYIDDQLILDGNDTKMGMTERDLPEVKKLLKSQWTFFPTFESENYSLIPSEPDLYRSKGLKNELKKKILSMNEELPAPTDAQVILDEGKIIVSKSVDGKEYDVTSLLTAYEEHGYSSEIYLDPIYSLPITEDSEIIKNGEKKLQELLDFTVDYNVQDHVHSLKGSDVIHHATVSKDLEVAFDPSGIQKKVTEINDAQSTLGKDFNFTTTSGGVISVKGQGYGWALDVKKETDLIQAAFQKNETSVSATNIIGNGWNNEGYGYETLANNGIGNTYAEVSIAEQRIWLYRDGELVVTTNVVTGKRSTGEDTSPGVWYILFKRTPYTLNGSSVGSGTYSIEVDYWAPFTNSGQGFHDASWRTNWNSNAYHTGGSGGCINVQPSMMKKVYDNLTVYQPVVVY
ncbi:L,D-transpeptidase family protein [Bacillus sp. B15-48]|uniref:L,D-transpeptidase family protein n=1 Tax=Bacillus sp. B15-48 TaxID=1548601 RepID=UPI00193F9813|nr:L,D-transpeptidase family protein [Bacillus sp. B15-48]MBM4761773.1 L,D-transpeptidase family protein [Bacillus sp. B15-48]